MDPEKAVGVVESEKDGALKEDATLHQDEQDEERDETANDAPPALPFSKARLIALVTTVTGAAFLNTVSVQSVVITLPTIGSELHIPDSRQQWIVSSYSLTFGCFMLLWGRLADVYGRRLIFIWGSAWVTLTTIAIPFAKQEIAINVLRGLQGLGGAANVPTALGILGVTFPPGKAKNYAFSCYGAGAPLGAVFGNLLGGFVGQFASWEWIFWILAIFAAIVTVAGYFVIPLPPLESQESASSNRYAVDWIGGTIVTVGLIILMFALTEGNVVSWSTPWVPVLIVISILLVGIFAVWQWYLETKTTRKPLMKITIWKNHRFAAAMVVMLMFHGSFNNYLVFGSYFFQDYQGHNMLQTTLRFIPTGATGIFICFLMGALLSRVRGDIILIFGTFSLAISGILFAAPIPPSTNYFAYCFPAMIFAVLGADSVYPALTLFTAQSLPQEDQSLGGALINVASHLGRAIGLALGTAVETAVIAADKGIPVADVGNSRLQPGDGALLKGLRAAEWFDVGLALAACGLAAVAFRGVGKLGARH